MKTLFPNATSDIATAMDEQPYDLDAAIEGAQWEARIAMAEPWFERLMLVCINNGS